MIEGVRKEGGWRKSTGLRRRTRRRRRRWRNMSKCRMSICLKMIRETNSWSKTKKKISRRRKWNSRIRWGKRKSKRWSRWWRKKDIM